MVQNVTKVRWVAPLILALALGGWSGRVVGAPPGGVVAQSGGTSSSGSGASASSANGDSGNGGSSSSGSSSSSGGGTGGTGGGTGDGSDGTDGTTVPGDGDGDGAGGEGQAAPTTAPPNVQEEAIADGEETDCGNDDATQRCYEVEQVEGVEAVRVPDGHGGTKIVALGDVPRVNVDSGASTSASSNVDLRVDLDVDTGDVIRVERRVDPARQFALITLAALIGVFVGAAVLGTFLRFRNGPKGT